MKDELDYTKGEFDIDKASAHLGISDIDDDSPVLDLDIDVMADEPTAEDLEMEEAEAEDLEAVYEEYQKVFIFAW